MRELHNLIPEYIAESREYLVNIEDDVMLMEQGNHDYELIDRISRGVRSIKGRASFLGLTDIEKLSRKIEEIFNLFRNRELEFNSRAASIILKSITKLKEMLTNNGNANKFDINAHLLELDICFHDKLHSAYRQIKWSGIDLPLILDKFTVEALKKKGKKIFHLQFELRELHYANYNSPLEFFQEMEKTGEIIELKVDMELVLENENFTGEGIPLSLFYATGLDKEIVAYIFSIDENQVMELEE